MNIVVESGFPNLRMFLAPETAAECLQVDELKKALERDGVDVKTNSPCEFKSISFRITRDKDK